MQLIRFTRFGGPEVLEAVDAPVPRPQAGEALVRSVAIGVGMPDVLLRSGAYPWTPALPLVPGNELAGVVEEIGPGVDAVQPGDRVYLSSRELPMRGGCYAAFVCAPAGALLPLPSGLGYEEASCLSTFQLARHLLEDGARARPGERVLIVGASGGVGDALIQTCGVLRLEAIAVANTDGKAEAARRAGAVRVVRPGESPFAVARDDSRDLRVDCVLDPLGAPYLDRYFDLLGHFGVVVSYGMLAGPAEVSPAALAAAYGRSPALRFFTMHTLDGLRERRRAVLAGVAQEMAAGTLRPRIALRLPLTQAGRAHELLEQRRAAGRIVLEP